MKLNRAPEISQNSSLGVDKDHNLAETQQAIGKCLTGLQQYDNSSSCLEQSLKILSNTTLDDGNDIKIALPINCMGKCLLGKQQYMRKRSSIPKKHTKFVKLK